MLVAAVADFKARLSGFLRRVKAGEEVVVTERGRPIARVVPVGQPETSDSRTAELAGSGLIKLSSGPLTDAFWTMPRPVDAEGRALGYLLEERAEDR